MSAIEMEQELTENMGVTTARFVLTLRGTI